MPTNTNSFQFLLPTKYMTKHMPNMIMPELRFSIVIRIEGIPTYSSILQFFLNLPMAKPFLSTMAAMNMMRATLAISAVCMDTPPILSHLVAPWDEAPTSRVSRVRKVVTARAGTASTLRALITRPLIREQTSMAKNPAPPMISCLLK